MSTATSYIFEMRSELTGAFREENIRKIKDSFVIALVVGLLEVACPALLSSLFLKRWVLGGIYDTVYRIIVAFRSQCNKRRKSKTVAAEGVRLFSKKKKNFSSSSQLPFFNAQRSCFSSRKFDGVRR